MKSDKPNPNNPAQRPSRAVSNDFLLDPLPVPDAVESDSDTAWGLWELSLQEDAAPADTPTQPADFDQMTEPQDFQGPENDFQSTVPASLEDLEKLLKR